jgi:hypothetical protein
MTSTIKVNNIQNACGTNIIKRCGTTTTVGSGASNPIVVCGSTVTIGRCGGTVSLASGATQSGFGRAGSVNWQTGSIKTSTFTAVDGEGYFVDTSSGAVTANLPAGSAGAIVAFADYTRTFSSNNLTISPNGSNKIGGIAQDTTLIADGQSATFVFVDATEGWINVQETSDTKTGIPPLIKATGGTETTDGNFKIHTFTGPGTFTVNCVATEPPAPEHNIVSYIIAGGGASGGGAGVSQHVGGGGGAGGFREVKNSPIDSYTASPKDGFSTPGNRVTVTAQAYPIVVGAGGTHPGTGPQRGGNGNVSSFAGISAAAGGGGGALGHPSAPSCRNGGDGGSGGGGSSQVAGSGGNGNSPTVTPPQGNSGGQGVDAPPDLRAGGGGGAVGAGTQGTPSGTTGTGGAGATSNITGSPVGYAGGGGGGATCMSGPKTSNPSPDGSGAAGGDDGEAGNAAISNRAGGGGGAGGSTGNPANQLGGNGGSGVVIIRYKFQ